MIVADNRCHQEGSAYTSRYEVLSQEKTILIYSSGYGVVRFKTSLIVTDENFAGPLHYIGVDKSVPKKHSLPSIMKMQDVDFDQCPPAAFLNYVLLMPRHQGFRLMPSELPTQRVLSIATRTRVEEGRVRAFLFEISPRCSVGQELSYSWEWGFPELFRMRSGEEESSSYECLSRVGRLDIHLMFLHESRTARRLFHRRPMLEVVRDRDGEESFHLDPYTSEGLRELCYDWTIGQAEVGDRFVLRWTTL